MMPDRDGSTGLGTGTNVVLHLFNGMWMSATGIISHVIICNLDLNLNVFNIALWCAWNSSVLA